MAKPQLDNFNSMSAPMQELIIYVVTNACDYVNDVSIEMHDPLSASFGAVYDQAIQFLVQELDPDNGAFTLPEVTKLAIQEVVKQSVVFSVNRQFLK